MKTMRNFSNHSSGEIATHKKKVEDVSSKRFAFAHIDFHDDDVFMEPDYIKQNRDEFELFLVTSAASNRTGEELLLKPAESSSPISTFHIQRQCQRMYRNYGPQKAHAYYEQQLESPRSILSALSSKMGLISQIKLSMPTLSREKLRQELNSLVAYRHRRQQVLRKLQADLSQVKFTISQSRVFQYAADLEEDSPDARNRLRSPRESPMRMSFSDLGSSQKFQRVSIQNVQTLDRFIPTRAYSPKSQIGVNTNDQKDQLKNLQLAQTVDEFSIVDLEFRKVQLKTEETVKEKQIDEALFEQSSLCHQLELERKQNIVNQKKLNDIAPDFQEYEAIGQKFQHISAACNFRKIFAVHLIHQRTVELESTHKDHQEEVNRLVEVLREEGENLRDISRTLNSKQKQLDQLQTQINDIRVQQKSFAETKKKWLKFLRIKHLEHRKVKILSIFVLLQRFDDLKHASSRNQSSQDSSSVQSLHFNPAKRSDSELVIVDSTEVERNHIFNQLYQTSVQLAQLQDFRGFCNQVLNATSKEDVDRFFEQDKAIMQQFKQVELEFDPLAVKRIYNESQFNITSLSSRHQFLMEAKASRLDYLQQLQLVRSVITLHAEDIADYLKVSGMIERGNLDLTIQDKYYLMQVQSKYLQQGKETLQLLIPQVKSFVNQIHGRIKDVEKQVRASFQEEQLLPEFGKIVIGHPDSVNTGNPRMNFILPISIESIKGSSKGTPSNSSKSGGGFGLSVNPSMASNLGSMQRKNSKVNLNRSNSKLGLNRSNSKVGLQRTSSKLGISLPIENPGKKSAAQPQSMDSDAFNMLIKQVNTIRKVASKRRLDRPNASDDVQAHIVPEQLQMKPAEIQPGKQPSSMNVLKFKNSTMQPSPRLSTQNVLQSKLTTRRVNTRGGLFRKATQRYKDDDPIGLLQSTYDLRDKRQLIMYLNETTQDTVSGLDKICDFVRACKRLNNYMMGELNKGKKLEIDYSYFEKVYHETKYMKLMSMNPPKMDHFSHSSSTSPWQNPFNQSFVQQNSVMQLQGGSKIDLDTYHSQLKSPGTLSPPPYLQKGTAKQIIQKPEDDSNFDSFETKRHARTAVGSSRGAKTARSSFQGSDIMNEKFKKIRGLQMFDCRENAFLKAFKRRIHDSYFSNN